VRTLATTEAEGVAPAPATAPPAAVELPPQHGYRPLPKKRVLWGTALAAALVLLGLLPFGRFGDKARFATTRTAAREAAARSLKESGFDVASYHSAVQVLDRTDPAVASYLLKTGGLDVANNVYGTKVPTRLWRVRFFVPGQKEEYGVSVDPATGGVVGFARTLLEDAEGATLDKERALEVARAFLMSHGVDPASGEIKEQTAKDEKARRDHTLVWEFQVAGAGEARVRHEVVVQGDVVGSWGRSVWIPEDWRRERERQTALTVILAWAKLPLLAGLGILALLLLIANIRAGAIPWKFALAAGGVTALAAVVRTGLNADLLWGRYDTSVPAGGFLVFIGLALLVGGLMFFLLGATAAGLAGAVHPAATSMLSAPSRRVLGPDALVSGLLAFGLAFGLPGWTRLLAAAIPAGRLIGGASFSSDISATVPFLTALAGAVSLAILMAAAGGIVAAIAARNLRGGVLRGLVALAFVLSFLPATARTPAEYALGALSLVALLAGVVVLVTCFLRANPLAWLFSCWFAFGGVAAIRLIMEPAALFRWSGVLLVGAIAASAWLLRPQADS
jgi:hypothetical protein